jgi:predicted AAA+ superfamily ATPase
MSVGVERLIETYIKYKLIRKGAVLIEGPKCVGKSFSCERLSKSKILLKSDLNFIARVREVLDFALVGEFPRFIGE